MRATKSSSATILKQVHQRDWLNIPLIVRSSAHNEDRACQSLAGHYCSKLNVLGETSLISAVKEVIASLDNAADQIFLQPMIHNVALSGVAFSCDPNTGSPYYIINYDDESGLTDTVTSGNTNHKAFVYVKGSRAPVPNALQGVVALLIELESIINNEYLDIEFAIDQEGKLYLLQARPLSLSKDNSIEKHNLHTALKSISNKINSLARPHPYLYGETTMFGVMPDWNPAEIIGVRPRPLALSLYRELITDNIWAYQRDNYGYRNLRSFPLMVDFHGLPYIDVRVSFNSFIPNKLEPRLAERLVCYYINQLKANPSLHDKVEFEILFSCYTLDIKERLQPLNEYGFSKEDQALLSDSLRQLTNNIIHNKQGLWLQDLKKIRELESRRRKILDSELDLVARIYWLLEDCKRYGTLPFAGLARAGFIAVQLIQSLVKVQVLRRDEYESFMSSLDLISSRMTRDLSQLSRETFLEKYGHLRPGTYDILSPRYDEKPSDYFDFSAKNTGSLQTKNNFKLSLSQLSSIDNLLKDHGIEQDVLGFFDFIKSGIEGREYAKFVFTRSLSDAISLIKKHGQELGFSAEDCSFININCIRELYASSQDPSVTLKKNIAIGKERYDMAQKIVLPSLITSANDVWSFHLQKCEPNFITQKIAQARTTSVEGELMNAIVLIQNADPGYDWIFSKNIAGFITKYGGINSHMAIRAGELGIPAVIGAGEILFNCWQKATLLKIDCTNKQVQVIK